MKVFTILAMIVVGIACGSAGPIPTPASGDFSNVDFGPLAVREPEEGPYGYPAISAGTGPVHIGENCVTITNQKDDRTYLLVWRADSVRWLRDQQIVVFPIAFHDEPFTIRDGDVIELGPGGVPVSALKWVSPPHESCERRLMGTVGISPPS